MQKTLWVNVFIVNLRIQLSERKNALLLTYPA